MKIHFDPNQQFQLDAVAAVTDLFEGQPQSAPSMTPVNVTDYGEIFAGQAQTELGVGNQLVLDEARLQANTRTVQQRNDIEIQNPANPLEAWELFDAPAGTRRNCPHFSVEMETGTGKTYVYLRAIFELSQKYGFQKFIIVVPSVAIREGVLKNLEITAEHFNTIYNLAPQYFVYDAKRINRLRQFATSSTLQILVINIDAFRKNFTGTDEEKKSNVIYKESDKLSGRQPIEFVQAARPIVIIDEPQSVDSTDKAQEAIKALNPLCTLRYSATHTNPYNLIYQLDPVRAFDLKLVKQIVVASAAVEGGANDAFVRVEKIDYKNGIKAKLRIQEQTENGPREKLVTAKQGADLHQLSNERSIYKDGYEIAEINAEPENEYIRFSNGRVMRLGEESGGMKDDIWRAQIHHTVKRHLEKELQVRERGIKVLSLFFIDRVAHYRDYDQGGKPIAGKFANAFEETLAELMKEERFKPLAWLKLPVEKLHNGYFAQDKKGILKDTRGDTQADDEVYNLIMKEKEKLLSIEEPLRFIFSHSALREGWDNPNVFQICNLREMSTERERRQTLGRGLRLPVDQNGERVRDDSVNKLYVFANETYEDFARGLQSEYEKEGISFGKVPLVALSKLTRIEGEEEKPIGREAAEQIRAALIEQNLLDENNRILPDFEPARPGFKLNLPDNLSALAPAVTDLLSSYILERHIRREKNEGTNKFKKAVEASPEFLELWNRIKPKTTYRVEFKTDDLVASAVRTIKAMPRIEAPKVVIRAGQVQVKKGGVAATAQSVSQDTVEYGSRPVPDILAYLQEQTELTRATLVRILKESDRLSEFFLDPQKFMDMLAHIIKHELRRLLVDGIKYEKLVIDGREDEWEMALFKNEEVINYLSALQVKKSTHEYVVYSSIVEQKFAEKLDQRDDIKLFLKLPDKFFIETPVGKYIPDWAIVKHGDDTIYMVRETKGVKKSEFLKLRNSESDKIRCGIAHFEAIGVNFDMVTDADEVA
ncbi:MAG: DEAD/DEAH box helicase family protein [Anaerolineales bacterium]|nr:DEAD/DEAH box helicase family protein [Anaerolineales bacterium]